MPRNGAGTYSVPAGTTVTTGTVIESAPYNSFIADIQSALNDVKPASPTFTGTLSGVNGTFSGTLSVTGSTFIGSPTVTSYRVSIRGTNGSVLYLDGPANTSIHIDSDTNTNGSFWLEAASEAFQINNNVGGYGTGGAFIRYLRATDVLQLMGTFQVDSSGDLISGSIGSAVTGVTQSFGDNSTKLATTEHVTAASGAILWVRDERGSGVEGGSPPATDSWFARTLQTIEANNIAGASLASNQVTLPAGTYTIQAAGNVYRTHWSRLRLYNVTESESLITAPMVHAWDSAAHEISQHLMGRFVLSAPTTLELQQIVNRDPGSSALGQADHWGQATVFAEAFIRRIA